MEPIASVVKPYQIIQRHVFFKHAYVDTMRHMRLTSLEISGFKSFAKKDSFSFETAISSIVGPNGSGKSNVAEAFRFVLGEQSEVLE